MFFADRTGLERVVSRIEEFASGYQGWAWSPRPCCAARRRKAGLAELNGEGA